MNNQIMSSLAATMLLVGCAHQKHGDRHQGDNGLVSTVVKYPFKMAEYMIWSPFHPIESTRMAIETTAEVPMKVLDATSEAHALNMRLLFGHGESQSPEPPKVKAPDISIHKAAKNGDIEVVKQHLASGEDVNAKLAGFGTPLDLAKGETADLLRKHGGKTSEELKAERK